MLIDHTFPHQVQHELDDAESLAAKHIRACLTSQRHAHALRFLDKMWLECHRRRTACSLNRWCSCAKVAHSQRREHLVRTTEVRSGKIPP